MNLCSTGTLVVTVILTNRIVQIILPCLIPSGVRLREDQGNCNDYYCNVPFSSAGVPTNDFAKLLLVKLFNSFKHLTL